MRRGPASIHGKASRTTQKGQARPKAPRLAGKTRPILCDPLRIAHTSQPWRALKRFWTLLMM